MEKETIEILAEMNDPRLAESARANEEKRKFEKELDNRNCKNCNKGGEPEIIGVTPVIHCNAKATYVPAHGSYASNCINYELKGGSQK